MRNRLATLVIMALALGAVSYGLWVGLQGRQLAGVSYVGVPDSFLFLTLRRLLPERPELFLATLRAYALAVTLAGGLAIMLTVRARQIPAANLLASALAGLAFFTAQLAIGHNVPGWAGGVLVQALDYVALAGFFYGAWFVVHATHNYPQRVDLVAVFEYSRPEAMRKIRDRTMQPGGKKSWLQWYLQKDTAMEKKYVQGLSSAWSPAIFSVVAAGLLALWQLNHRGVVEWMGLYILLAVAALGHLPLAWGALDLQYRTGNAEDRARISWLALGLVICGWVSLITYGGAMLWLIKGGGEAASRVLVGLTALLPPVLGGVFLLLLVASIFFRGAIDPRLAIRKTSLYGFAALIITVVVAFTQNAAVVQVVGRLGLPAQSGSIFAGVAVAVVMAPMRRRIETRMEQAVDRFLPASTLAESAREQAAVVFADLSGYTELSARDESKALTFASLLHKESRRWAERHGGQVVKTIGDAVLFTFPEPGAAAAMCADLNQHFAVAARALQLPALPLHFGIHVGEVVRQRDGDVFGGTVNLAARLQGLAKAGELVVSGAVAAPLRAAGFNLESIGDQKLKNVPEPVACFKVALT